jgi:hypothetical protein
VTDIRARLRGEGGEPPFHAFPHLLCVSYHTTAGFMDRTLQRRLAREPGRLPAFLSALRDIFPPEAGYQHDRLHLRHELSEEQKRSEPLNADAHLSVIGGGFTNCSTCSGRSAEPLWFVDFDGTYRDRHRRRIQRTRMATVVGYSQEEVVEVLELEVEISAGEARAVKLTGGDPPLLEPVLDAVRRHGVGYGRVDLRLPPGERDAAMTVNEFEALLMQRDLAAVLEEPLRYAGAPTDLTRAMGALGVSARRRDRLMDRALETTTPARLLRMRRGVSLAILPAGGSGAPPGRPGRIVLGTYQSPILVQWSPPEGAVRVVEASVVRFG